MKGRPDSHWLILNPQGRIKNVEEAAQELLHHIRRLRGDARRCWTQARQRVFDIGVQAGGPGRAFEEVQLQAATLGRIAAVGAQVQVTVYAASARV
jgi:hypothetical protein